MSSWQGEEMKRESEIFFPPFHLDLANEQLWREKELIPLRPKTFAVLRYLVEHAGRLVTKDELLHAVWGETQVSEEGLRDYLREIRQALGDEADAPRFVETVRGRGYRFLPSITTQPVQSAKLQVPSPAPPPTPNPPPLTPNVVLTLPDKPSIIVLPFVNLSHDPEQEYFSDGITEDLTNALSRISSLFVISRTSAFTYKNKPTKVQDISQEMGVQYVVEGSVRRADNQVRVTAQLIDAIADHHLWSQRYDRPLKDIFALQDEIVQKIVTTLNLQLTLQEQGHIVRKRTDNLEAYDSLLRGIALFFRFTQEANAQARQMFERAIALDSQYAEAYAWLSFTYYFEWVFFWSADPQTLGRALVLAQQAAALDDSLPRAHAVSGRVYVEKQQYDQAIAEGERAIALDPNHADSYTIQAGTLILAGRPDEALRMVEQAMRLNPRYPSWYLHILSAAYYFTGRPTEAVATAKEFLSRNPGHLYGYLGLALSYLLQWEFQQGADAQTLAQALAAAQRIIALNASFSGGHIVLGAVYL
jgi:TolB-like protein/DNA-binding winged helix-turn-helix (wHTH) protein/lipopolysaccharide biosynthesis regulator YciM